MGHEIGFVMKYILVKESYHHFSGRTRKIIFRQRREKLANKNGMRAAAPWGQMALPAPKRRMPSVQSSSLSDRGHGAKGSRIDAAPWEENWHEPQTLASALVGKK